MKAMWNGQILAESDQTVEIEGNAYFPPDSVNKSLFQDSETTSVCPWKGNAKYYNIVVNGETNTDGAWYYPEPKEGSEEVVGQDFTNYVAFWNGVEVVE